MNPRDVLAGDHRDALEMLRNLGVARTRKILARAQRELDRRLAEAVRGPGADSFTAAQARAALGQVREATRVVQRGVRDVLLDGAGEASERSAENLARYLEAANRSFRGVARPLGLDLATIVDEASSGVRATVLRRLASSGTDAPGAAAEPHRARAGILERYGLATVGHFEQIFQQGLIARTPWEEVRANVAEASPFLQGAPRFWAERVCRTELHGVYNRAGWESIREVNVQSGGDFLMVLSATFDDRTGADSWNVHGEVRRPDEPFEYINWRGESEMFFHPPNRPNDREIVVPHRESWPIPPYLVPKDTGIVRARYARDKQKFYRRPKMSTVAVLRRDESK